MSQQAGASQVAGPAQVDELRQYSVAGISLNDIYQHLLAGRIPRLYKDFSGRVRIQFMEAIDDPTPRLFIRFTLKVCSYLGNYGAGKVLRTFSLLPGEKTKITLRSYRSETAYVRHSRNVMDSFSEDSAQEMETLIENEARQTSTFSENQFMETIKARGVEARASVGANIPLKVASINAQVSGGVKYGTQDTKRTETMLSDSKDVLDKSLDRHVSNTNTAREVTVNVNTETERRTESTNEEVIERHVENVNLSRVLNFVFRQMLQEYITVTYLDDVTITFANGDPERNVSGKLADLDALLAETIKTGPSPTNEYRLRTKNLILSALADITDHTGTKRKFWRKIEDEVVENVLFPAENEIRTYYTKDNEPDPLVLSLSGDRSFAIKVPGIITNVRRRVLRTDSVIVDALLGQGEALDCYNSRMQETAVAKAGIEALQQIYQIVKDDKALAAIDALTDPAEKAEAVRRLLRDCCSDDVLDVLKNLEIGVAQQP